MIAVIKFLKYDCREQDFLYCYNKTHDFHIKGRAEKWSNVGQRQTNVLFVGAYHAYIYSRDEESVSQFDYLDIKPIDLKKYQR